MRLLSKISHYYFWLSLFVLCLTGFLLYLFLRTEISTEIEEQLELQTDMVAHEIDLGRTVSFPLVQVVKGTDAVMKIPKVFKDTLIYDRLQDVNEGYYYLAGSKKIGNSYYRIKVMTTYIGWSNYSLTIGFIFIAIAIMLVVLGTLTNYFISRKIWNPFLINLKKMKGYSVRSNEELKLADTDVVEFREMNLVLTDLADRSKREYAALKQFTENASHEIQTPLSILKTRLENMGQHPLDEALIPLLNDAKTAVSRLSKVNKGLLLLAKLENDVFEDKAWLQLSDIIKKNYELLEDLLSHKQLRMSLKLEDKAVFASASLIDILITNLFSNIINHAQTGAEVLIELNEKKLVMVNDGPLLTFSESLLFTRFTKGSRDAKRNGLGLAIIKQICINNNWEIAYCYAGGKHSFTIVF
ncbi:sensor histidine kinase [Pedobacter sp. PWIIR3]